MKSSVVTAVFTCVLLSSLHAPLRGGVIGETAINRSFVDGSSGSLFLYNGLLPVGETIVSFTFFDNNHSNANWVTPLLLSFSAGNTYQIVGIGQSVQNQGIGAQTSSGTWQGTNITQSNYYFGWWNGRILGSNFFPNSGVVEFDSVASNPGFRESCTAQNTPPCAFSPTVGSTLAFANNYNGSAGNFAAPNGRVYSAFVTTELATPEPSSGLMTLTGLIVLTALARHYFSKG